jgi:hypothetical protein
MPEILSIAIKAKSQTDVLENKKNEAQSSAETKTLLRKLNHYSEILKEKE